jgi:hypothetical protein
LPNVFPRDRADGGRNPKGVPRIACLGNIPSAAEPIQQQIVVAYPVAWCFPLQKSELLKGLAWKFPSTRIVMQRLR